jgi:hypothetical protein
MDFITPIIKLSIDALKSILGAARRKWGKRKYEKLLATTFSELLKEHPDLTAAEANLAAAKATGATPDVNLLRAKSMYGSALRFHARKKQQLRRFHAAQPGSESVKPTGCSTSAGRACERIDSWRKSLLLLPKWDDNVGLEALTKRILKRLKSSKFCTVFETDLERVWPIVTRADEGGVVKVVREEETGKTIRVDFLFTLKFDEAGKVKIVKTQQLSEEESQKYLWSRMSE